MPQSNNLCTETDRIHAKDVLLKKIKDIKDQTSKFSAPAHKRHCPFCEPQRCPLCDRPLIGDYPEYYPQVWC